LKWDPRADGGRAVPGLDDIVSLNDADLCAIMAAAHSVPPDRRADFLEAAASLLAYLRACTSR
jgi:hypothetical protein